MQMNLLFSRTCAILALAVAGIAPQAQGGVIVYTNAASFTSAVWEPGADSFGDLAPSGTLQGTQGRSAGAYAYQARVLDTSGAGDGGTDFFTLDGGNGSTWLSTNFAGSTLLFDGFGGTVRAIGGVFFGSDVDGGPMPAQSLVFTVTDASGTFEFLSQGGFIGFASTASILSLSVANAGAGMSWPALSGLTLAEVPEPASLPLFVFSGILLAVALRRMR